jgi:hypothetical protein
MDPIKFWLKRALCFFSLSFLHWQGQKGLGMYGDAAKCDVCGADRYGLLVFRDTNPYHAAH